MTDKEGGDLTTPPRREEVSESNATKLDDGSNDTLLRHGMNLR